MFKKDQRVRCIDNVRVRDGYVFPLLTVGKIYTVLKDQDGFGYIWVKDDSGVIVNFLASRFEEAQKKGFFNVGDKAIIHLPPIQELRDKKWQYQTKHKIDGVEYLSPGMNDRMYEYNGKEVEIVEVRDKDRYLSYKVSVDGEQAPYVWFGGWLLHIIEEAPQYKIGDAVCVIAKGVDGVAPKWIARQDKAIGKKRTVKAIEKNYVILSDNLAYQLSSIEKWNPKKHEKPKTLALRKVIAEARKAAKPRGLCSFTLIFSGNAKDPSPKSIQRMAAPCHAALNTAYDDDVKAGAKPLAVIDWISYHMDKMKPDQQKIYKKWVDYCVHQSPWAPAYVQKETKNVLLNGADMNVNVSADLLAAACINMRTGTEYPHLLKAFGFWISKGFSGKVAHLLAYSFGKSKDGKKFHLQGMDGGHSTLYGGLLAGGLLSLYKNGYDKKHIEAGDNSYVNNTRYRVQDPISRTSVDESFKELKNVSWSQYLKDSIKSEVKGRGWDQVIVYAYDDLYAFAKQLEKAFA